MFVIAYLGRAKMAIFKPRKVGQPVEIIPRKYNKTLIEQKFSDPITGEISVFRFFAGTAPSIVLPITTDFEVVLCQNSAGFL